MKTKITFGITSLLVISTLLLSSKPGTTDIPACKNIPKTPQPGDRCYTIFPINLRVHNQTEERCLRADESLHQPRPGWAYLSHEIVYQEPNLGNSRGPHFQHVQANSRYVSGSDISKARNELNNFLAEMEGKVNTPKSPPVEGYGKIKVRAEEKLSEMEKSLASVESTHQTIRMSACAQAVWNAFAYIKGGRVRADVKVYDIYVGDQNYLNNAVNSFKQEARELAAKTPPSNTVGSTPSTTQQQPSNTVGSTPSTTPRTFFRYKTTDGKTGTYQATGDADNWVNRSTSGETHHFTVFDEHPDRIVLHDANRDMYLTILNDGKTLWKQGAKGKWSEGPRGQWENQGTVFTHTEPAGQ